MGSLRLRQDLEDYEKVLSGWDLYIQGLRRELMLRAPKTASTVRKIRADVRLRWGHMILTLKAAAHHSDTSLILFSSENLEQFFFMHSHWIMDAKPTYALWHKINWPRNKYDGLSKVEQFEKLLRSLQKLLLNAALSQIFNERKYFISTAFSSYVCLEIPPKSWSMKWGVDLITIHRFL